MIKFIMPTLLFNIERWKWNDDFRVYVSNMGHFKDEYKKPLSVFIDGKGYCKIKTSCGWKAAHRLVMLTWRPIPNAEDLTVDHLDHNKRNNSLANLEWVTDIENRERAKRDRVCHAPLTAEEIKNFTAKNDTKVTDGDTVYNSVTEAALVSFAEHNKKSKPLPSAKTLAKMERRLTKAILNKTSYDSRYWSYVEEE